MMSKLERPRAPPCIPAMTEGAGAVDAWLRLALAQRYDPVLDETLPADILAALAQTH